MDQSRSLTTGGDPAVCEELMRWFFPENGESPTLTMQKVEKDEEGYTIETAINGPYTVINRYRGDGAQVCFLYGLMVISGGVQMYIRDKLARGVLNGLS